MNQSPKLLRILIGIQWGLVILEIAVLSMANSKGATEIQAYIEEQHLNDQPVILGSVLFVALVIAYIVTSIGLFCLRPWAKTAYIVTASAGLCMGMAQGIIVSNGLSDTLASLDYAVTGAIVGFLLFSPIGHNWKDVRSWQ